jgi:hypothetical protein
MSPEGGLGQGRDQRPRAAARGEAAYADDYRRQARAAVPDAPWRA